MYIIKTSDKFDKFLREQICATNHYSPRTELATENIWMLESFWMQLAKASKLVVFKWLRYYPRMIINTDKTDKELG